MRCERDERLTLKPRSGQTNRLPGIAGVDQQVAGLEIARRPTQDFETGLTPARLPIGEQQNGSLSRRERAVRSESDRDQCPSIVLYAAEKVVCADKFEKGLPLPLGM